LNKEDNKIDIGEDNNK